jgi:aminobenzoyl-glutamate transport protein
MSLLDRIERAGNALPDPATLFFAGAVLVMLLSHLAVAADWEVSKTVSRDGAQVIETVRARSLLTADGAYWAVKSMVVNFKDFPPLAIVLVGMLGIGLADKTGFIGALLKAMLLAVPSRALTPTVFFVGVLSSMALDAGYVVLPPVAAALYAAVGRSPLAGLAAVFAGVAAGFSANIAVTSLDAILAGFSEAGAHILDEDYAVAATANLYFMIASTFVLTGVGWATTALWVEPRLADKPADEGGPVPATSEHDQALTEDEGRGLRAGGIATLAMLTLYIAATWIPGAPLHGDDGRFPRWVAAIIPLIFLGFLVPGLAYGFTTGRLKNDRDVANVMGETMAGMGPYIVLAFFAAQFVAYFSYSGLGEMLAITGGQALASAALPAPILMLAFVGVVMTGNLFIGSMSAKYAFFAPVFVPMFMAVGISPELTQAAYRVGDSITNVVTPLNPYMVILLVFLRQWVPKGGIGTLMALMVPYAVAFAAAWSALLVLWMVLGIPLGPAGPLEYVAP